MCYYWFCKKLNEISGDWHRRCLLSSCFFIYQSMVSFGPVSHIFFCMRDAQGQLKSSRPYNDESLLIYIKKSYILITLFISNALQLCSVYSEITIRLISYCFTIKKTVVMGLRIQPDQIFLSTIKAKPVIFISRKW